MNYKTFKNQACQGELFIRRVDNLPEGLVKEKPELGRYIVGHSESGHHHSVNAEKVEFYVDTNNPFNAFLQVNQPSYVTHEKTGPDVHDSLRLEPGIYEIHRQREMSPQGWRRVAD